MKLIIDIDKDYVKIINKNGASNYPEEVIKNGTPLDDMLGEIRAEIEQAKIYILKTEDGTEIKASANDVINPDKRNYTSGLNTTLQIIDKYRRKERMNDDR